MVSGYAVFHPDFAAEACYDPLNQGESDAAPACTWSWLLRVKAGEDLVFFAVVYAWTMIFYLDFEISAYVASSNCDLDLLSPVIFHGVVEEVVEEVKEELISVRVVFPGVYTRFEVQSFMGKATFC